VAIRTGNTLLNLWSKITAWGKSNIEICKLLLVLWNHILRHKLSSLVIVS